MKRIITIGLAITLLFSIPFVVYGVADRDTIYYITEDEPSLSGFIDYATSAMDGSRTLFDFQYFKNKETYLELGLNDYSGFDRVVGSQSLALDGSYLFDSGFFVRSGLIRNKTGDTVGGGKFYAGPGYRYNFDSKNYIAGFIDYINYEIPVISGSNYETTNFSGFNYEFYGRHFPDRMKITEEIIAGHTNQISTHLQVNWLLTDGFVLGCDWNWHRDSLSQNSFFSEGFSYSNDILATNIVCQGNDSSIIHSVHLDGIYYISNNLGLGVALRVSQVNNWTPDSYLFKIKYKINESYIIVKFNPDDPINTWSVIYQKYL